MWIVGLELGGMPAWESQQCTGLGMAVHMKPGAAAGKAGSRAGQMGG